MRLAERVWLLRPYGRGPPGSSVHTTNYKWTPMRLAERLSACTQCDVSGLTHPCGSCTTTPPFYG